MLAGQPLCIVENLTSVSELEAEQPNTAMDIDQVLDVASPEVLAMATSGLPAKGVQADPPASEDDLEISGVRETLDEILANAKPSFSKACPSKTYGRDL